MHNWTSPGGHRPGMSAYLLEDGSLLRTANIAQTAIGNFSGGGTAGKVERISWEGDLLWSYEHSSTEYISHHDIEPMPNGNILMIAWESKTEEEGQQAGRNPAIASDAPGGSNGVWPDKIVEIQPNGTTGGDVVGVGMHGTTWCKTTIRPKTTMASSPNTQNCSTSTLSTLLEPRQARPIGCTAMALTTTLNWTKLPSHART